MMLWAPMIGAVIGTWFQLHEHPTIIRHGLVVSVPSGNEAIAGAAAGAIGGVVVAFLYAFLSTAIRYRLKGDDVWEAIYAGSDAGSISFALRCKGTIQVAPSTLGDVECWVRTPSGNILIFGQSGDFMWGRQGIWVQIPGEPETGCYETRWYAPRNKSQSHEIARVKTKIPIPASTPPELSTPAPDSEQPSTEKGS